MQNLGKHNLLGVGIDALDYEAATAKIVDAARNQLGLAVSALAVHGLMTGVADKVHRYRLNRLDIVTPDGQPIRWALNLLYRTKLLDRVYGPVLTAKVCEQAARQGLPVFFYGSKQETLERLAHNVKERFPGLIVAGYEPSKFRRTTPQEKAEIAQRIRSSGAKVTFVGLGCPRQEVFAFEYRDALGMPVIAVGAAFDYHAGLASEPPLWMQRAGLQWFHRLLQDPRRLWRRYIILNTSFLLLLTLQALRVWHPSLDAAVEPASDMLYG